MQRYSRSTSESLEVCRRVLSWSLCGSHSDLWLVNKPSAGLRSGLVPLHPALGSPDVREALTAQHWMHSSIFGGGSWSTERLGSFNPRLSTPDSLLDLVAVFEPGLRQLRIGPFKVRELQCHDSATGPTTCPVTERPCLSWLEPGMDKCCAAGI